MLCNKKDKKQTGRSVSVAGRGEMFMKKLLLMLVSVFCISLLTACSGKETDYAAAIMVNGNIYYKTAMALSVEIDESAFLGYTDSYTDTFPKKDGETNFSRELGMPYARVEEGIAVLYENEWYLCSPVELNGKHGTIDFYSVPTREKTEPEIVASFELMKEQEKEIKRIFDGVKEWIDDHSVDRLAYYYDGEIKLSDREFIYYFTYEYNVVYYNHYYAEISEKDMEYIKGLNK